MKIAELELTFGELEQLRVGQVLPVEMFDNAEVNVKNSTAFIGSVGEVDGKAAVELTANTFSKS